MTIKISCICITEDRPMFAPFVLWNYLKQTFPADKREFIIVDTSEKPYDWGEGVVLDRSLPHKSTIGTKYNRGVELALGEYVTFFDDDDYRGPDQLEKMWKATCEGGKPDIMRCIDMEMRWMNIVEMRYRLRKANIWAYSLYKREFASQFKFRGDCKAGADTFWLGVVNNAAFKKGGKENMLNCFIPETCVLLNHSKNVVNKYNAIHRLEWRHEVTKPASWSEKEWTEFSEHVRRIKEGLAIATDKNG